MAESKSPVSGRTVWSWCLYDFGNSAFTTLIVTFIYATYFTDLMAESNTRGTWLWSLAVSLTAVVVAILSPILGAIADQGGYRKRFLFLTTAIAVVSSAMLFFPLPHATTMELGLPSQALNALFWFVLGNIAFELGGVFYNAFLPDIAPPDRIGRISGYGWGLGYVGGLICMVIALVGFVNVDAPWFGFSTDAYENIRATNLLVAVWFAVFAIPIFLWVPETKPMNPEKGGHIRRALKQVRQTFYEVRKYRVLVRFLVARLFYNDGLVTIFAMGAVYAVGTLDFTTSEIIIFGIVLNVMAGLGALGFGFIDDRLGGKQTIMYSLYGLAIACLIAVFAPNKEIFWVAGIMVGIFAGPNQSASRSLMGRFVPPEKENEFFGFFAFSGKLTAFLGPFLFGLLTQIADSLFEMLNTEQLFAPQRAGITVVFILFAIGFYILRDVNEKEGIMIAHHQEIPS